MRAVCAILSSAMLALLGYSGCGDTIPQSLDESRRVPGELGPDGALHFANAAEFFEAVEAVDKLTASELDAWEQEIGFLSMRRAFQELEARLETAMDEERSALIAANTDLLHPNRTELARRVPAYGYAALIDRRGVMYVESVAHKVTDTEVLSSLDGNPATIELARTSGIAGGIDAFTYVTANPAKSPADMTADLTASCGSVKSGQSSTSDRRVKYETRTFTFTVTTPIGYKQYRYRIEWEFWGYKKFLGSWISYKTTYQLYNFGTEMDKLKVTGYDGVRHQYEYVPLSYYFPYYTSDPVELSNGMMGVFAGDMVENVDPTTLRAPFFRKLHQETTSRGTFPVRGTLECNYCGDGTCLAAVGENTSTCIADCGYCGDGICFGNEDASWCPDCVTVPCLVEACLVEPCLPCAE